MSLGLRPLHLALALVGACGLAVAGFAIYHRAESWSDDELLSRMPEKPNGVAAFIDVALLRRSRLLADIAGPKAVEDPDYRDFAETIAFDYRTDLDAIHSLTTPEASWFLLRGRFAWRAIFSYIDDNGGQCLNGYCSLRQSASGNHIAIVAMYPNVMGVAVGRSRGLAFEFVRVKRIRRVAPRYPVWISFDGSGLVENNPLPPGAAALIPSLRSAQSVLIGLDSAGDGFRAELRADCVNEAAARQAATNMAEMTDALQKFLSRQGVPPNPGDLSGVLVSGKFQQKGATVLGNWSVPKAFLSALTGTQ